ncbi:unnamed protein product [Orchesella dallaii]|uniref:CS domain-containing protein n=1 Tax=Orchesella dallaii TaxID=48710 RepID=A0ABP1PNN0_9HEXA
MDNSQNDPAFEAVLRNAGTIDPFLDAFFSFLARRTDFFVVSPPEGGKVGFPPGIAAKLIISKFKKWQDFCTVPPKIKEEVALPVPPVAQTITVESSNKSSNPLSTPAAVTKQLKKPNLQKAPSKVAQKKTEKDSEKSSNLWNSHNGRQSDKYAWSQSIKDLDVNIAIDKTIKTKRDLKVEILTKRVRITTISNGETEVVDWVLADPIIKDESYWSLYPGESVFLSLQKVKEKWWDHLFEGEERIDRNKIEAVRPMEELPDDEQVKIQEVVWNQEQKLKGLPTSEEAKLHKLMEKAWDVEGSPFKGQPFDPSLVHLANNTIDFPPGAQPPL